MSEAGRPVTPAGDATDPLTFAQDLQDALLIPGYGMKGLNVEQGTPIFDLRRQGREGRAEYRTRNTDL